MQKVRTWSYSSQDLPIPKVRKRLNRRKDVVCVQEEPPHSQEGEDEAVHQVQAKHKIDSST